ncbi:hypothetical protein ACFQ0B_51270 [Nonomuraea thailandensis]
MTTGRWALGGELSVARIGYGAMKLTGWPRATGPAATPPWRSCGGPWSSGRTCARSAWTASTW